MLQLAGVCAFGQERHTLGVFRSFPTGNFGSSKLGDGGFAKSGWGFLLENNAQPKLFPKFLTFATRFSYQKNELDNHALEKRFSEALGYQTRIGEAAYEPITLLAGPSIEIGLHRRLRLHVRAGAGVMFIKMNSFRIEVLDAQGGQLLDDVLDTNGNIPFAYLGGMQLRQIITKNISVNVFADYCSAKGKMGAKLGKIKTESSEFDVSTLNTGLSLRFDF